MIPLWRPLICATGAILLALPVDLHFRLLPQRNLVRWPLLALATLVGAYLIFASPTLAAVAAAGLGALALRRTPASSDEEPRPSHAPLIALAATISAFLAVALIDRAPTPCFWDAFVWLAKARYAAGGLGGLVAGGLHTTLPPFVPSGYPLFEPLSVALLAGFSPRPESVVAGAIGLEILTTLLFLCAIADDDRISPQGRATRLAAVGIVLLASPLVLVHLRSSYVDLPLGLLVGAFAVLLRRPRAGVACAVVAVAAVALKDEGMVHVAAITLVGAGSGLAGSRDGALVRRSIACGLCAAAVMAAWHLRLHMSGIANADHAISLPDWHRLRPLAGAVLEHLLEFRSWGALAVLGVGGTVAVAIKPRSAPRDAVWFAMLLLADALVLFVALLATPGRVMEFAAEGTLLNRLAIQLTPLAALLVAGWMCPVSETQEATPSRGSQVDRAGVGRAFRTGPAAMREGFPRHACFTRTMPREWRDIETRSALALVGIVIVAALGGGLAFAVIGWLSKADERVASAYLDRALLVEHARSAREEESASARAYLLTGSEVSLAASARDRATFEADYAELRASAVGPEDRELLETVARRDVAYEESVERVLALRRASAPEAEIRTDFEASVVPAKTELDTALLAASARAQRQVVRAHEAASDARVRVTAVVGLATLLVFVVASALAVFLRRAAQSLLDERGRLAESLARVEQSNRDLDAFAGRVAHDLRNAFSPVVMVSSLVRSSAGSPEKIASLCDRLDRANGRALVLLDALLAFARAQQETGGSPSASVAQVVAEALEQVEPDAAQADAKICSSVVDAQVRCPPGLLQVVVGNVLGNAVKFMRGQPERKIRLSTELVRGGCLLRIDDTGPGIPDAARERIFDPFFRVPGTKQPGTGIGLATVRRILEAHGGRITMEAREGPGCSFLVWLPLAESDHALSPASRPVFT